MYSYSDSSLTNGLLIVEMFHKENIVFFSCLISIVFAVDFDYVNDNPLRTHNDDACYSGLHELHCNIKCGAKSSLCVGKHCYCVYVVDTVINEDRPQMVYLAKPDEPLKEINLHSEDIQSNVDVGLENQSEPIDTEQSLVYSLRPTLRHHIAHFCPDLEVARTCIRTCMKVGKPAFCGKDHICYCGHNYSNTDSNPDANLQETYGQFRDLYEKYFGTANPGSQRP